MRHCSAGLSSAAAAPGSSAVSACFYTGGSALNQLNLTLPQMKSMGARIAELLPIWRRTEVRRLLGYLRQESECTVACPGLRSWLRDVQRSSQHKHIGEAC